MNQNPIYSPRDETAVLHEYAEWAEANIWEVPIDLPDVLVEAANTIQNLMEGTAGGT